MNDFNDLMSSYLFICCGCKITTKEEFLNKMSLQFDVINNLRNKFCFETFKSFNFIVEHSFNSGYTIKFL